MSVGERDPYSGHMTTGHQWNGIKELNTPVPMVVKIALAVTLLFSIGYWILMPTFPLGNTYTKGALGFDERIYVKEQIAAARLEQIEWEERLSNADFAEIQSDPELMEVVTTHGPPLYQDNCAVCHGSQGEGGAGFPRLNDDDWLWGNDPETINHTLKVGINSGHPETRVAQMPAFGLDGTLDGSAVRNVVLYVQSLTDPDLAQRYGAKKALAVLAGQKHFNANCAACHGRDGKGNPALGAPNLTDDVWLYGSDAQTLYTTIWEGRAGWMPAWEERLSPAERKILTLHVLGLSESATQETEESAEQEPAEDGETS